MFGSGTRTIGRHTVLLEVPWLPWQLLQMVLSKWICIAHSRKTSNALKFAVLIIFTVNYEVLSHD